MFGAATEQLADEPGDRLVQTLSRAAAAAEVPGFEITDRQVIGTFTYAKLPMVRDLQAAGDLLGDSDVVAAIAGDIDAQELLAGDDAASPARLARGGLLRAGCGLLPAQRDRRGAVRAQPGDPRAAGYRQEPDHREPDRRPGRAGRKVLFVAEKRAAIDAVLSRLKSVDLGEVVLDIHDGTGTGCASPATSATPWTWRSGRRRRRSAACTGGS